MSGTDLIVVEKLKTDILFYEDGVLDKVLEGIKSKIDEFEPDLETVTSRKEIASMARKVSSSKAFLDGIRKDVISEAKAKVDKANSVWKPAKEQLDEWRDEVRQPLTDWEDEQERIEQEQSNAIIEKMSAIRGIYTDASLVSASGLKQIIAEIEAIKIEPEEYFEFTVEANELKQEKLIAACKALEIRERLDAEEAGRKAESERQAKVAAEQAEIQRKLDEQQAKIDEANRKIQAEKDLIEAEKRVAEKTKEIEEAKKEAAEQARLAEIERQKADAEAEAAAKKKAKEDEIKREMLRPDKDKLAAFSQFLAEGVTYPNVESEEANAITASAYTVLQDLADSILRDSQRL